MAASYRQNRKWKSHVMGRDLKVLKKQFVTTLTGISEAENISLRLNIHASIDWNYIAITGATQTTNVSLFQILVCLFVSLPKYDFIWRNISKVASLKVIKCQYKYSMDPRSITLQSWVIRGSRMWNRSLHNKVSWLYVIITD